MMEFKIRDAVDADFPSVVALNSSAVHHTSPMEIDRLRHLDSLSTYHKVGIADGQVAAFLIAMKDSCGYINPNYEWFAARYPRFLYVDRIVVSSSHRGLHLGSRLYDDLFSEARAARIPIVACEYNVVPPNEPSRMFHDGFGFHEVGTHWVAGNSKRVSLQAATI